MTRTLTVAAAQLGPIARDEPRSSAVARMVALMGESKPCGADLVVFPELALTTFFPRWYMEDQTEVDQYFETAMPSEETQPRFDAARRLGVGFHLGYAELCEQEGEVHHFNTAILVDNNGEIVAKYRKVHLPRHKENEPDFPFQHLEKRYFETGDLGFPAFSAFGVSVRAFTLSDRIARAAIRRSG